MRGVTLAIVRHAHAGSRRNWERPDRDRPLSDKGADQATAIADHMTGLAPTRLVSSPAVRCQQTLGPLARRLGLDVEVDERLDEGSRELWLEDLLTEVADENVAVCSHGDVIPLLLDLLIDQGLPAPASLRWHKGSVWTVERAGASWGPASYWYPASSV